MEIPGNNLRKYETELFALLETICQNPIFRNSPKSCEFLRHVVHRSVEGNVDELKERLIGMSLLGRDPSYDTSTDSGVRVRANDVRKRLTKFNDAQKGILDFSITLPAGSYIPRFLHQGEPHHYEVPITASALEVEEAAPMMSTHLPVEATQRLTLFQLSAPTLAAVVLCIISMRWQLSQESSFSHFWQQIFLQDQAILALKSSRTDGQQGLIAIQELNAAAPLLDLAGQLHRQLTVMSSPNFEGKTSRMILHLGLNATSDLHSTIDGATPAGERFQLVSSSEKRIIVDRRDPSHTEPKRAALLTIINGSQSSIYIDGTDNEAIRSLVARLCDERTFPESLAGSFHPGTVTQAVFPLGAHATEVLDRETLTSDVAPEKLP